jgi:hypothetical protein
VVEGKDAVEFKAYGPVAVIDLKLPTPANQRPAPDRALSFGFK